MKNYLLRYTVSTVFAVTFSFLAISLGLAAVNFAFGGLMPGAFYFVTAVGIFLAAAYSSLIVQNRFNASAIAVGVAGGAVFLALGAGRPSGLPFYILWVLLVTTAVTFLAVQFFSRPSTFLWYGKLILAMHVLQSVVVISGVAYSLFHPWARPFILLITLTGFTIWDTHVMDGCPLTSLEDSIQLAKGEVPKYKKNGFIGHYAEKIFGINNTPEQTDQNLYIAALVYAAVCTVLLLSGH